MSLAALQLRLMLPCIAGAFLLSACSGAVVDGTSETKAASTLGCVDDSRACIDQRQAALKTLQADKSRIWVRQPATASSYATGVRLFAFKTEKARLTCDELASGRREADGAPAVLRSNQAAGLIPAQVSRGLMFAVEVAKELDREQQRRCPNALGLKRGV